MSSFHGFKSRKSGKSHLRTASYHGCSRESGVTASNVPDLHGLNLHDIPTLDIDKETSAALPSGPVSPHILTPNLHEIQRLKLTLLQIQNMIHSNDELILNVRQNLLRRMVNYLNSVKTKDRASTEYQTMVEIKADVDDILKEQGELIVSLRQDKLKQLVDLKPKTDTNQPHFQQGKLNRQLSRSVESCRVLNPPDDSLPLGPTKPVLPRLKGIQRSETARAERSLYFGELAKKSGNVMKRNKSTRAHPRRKSVEDIYAGIGEVHISRAGRGEKGDTSTQQSFLKLDKSGQLVFDTKSKNTTAPQSTQDSSKSQENASKTICDGSKTKPDSSRNQNDDFKTEHDSSKTPNDSSKTIAHSSKTQHNSLKTRHDISKTPNDCSKTNADSSKINHDSKTNQNISKTRDICLRKTDSPSKESSKPKDYNSNQIALKSEISISRVHDQAITKAKQPMTESGSKDHNLHTRPVLQGSFDSANQNIDVKSKTQCTQTSPQALDVKSLPKMVTNTVPTMSKKTQTDTKITENNEINPTCHHDENPMLSAEKDFVDVDDLIHFIQNHKPPTQPFVRGYNAVNSASFRESSTTFAAVENKISELPGIKRDRITISGSPQLRPNRGKSENLNSRRLQSLAKHETKPVESDNKTDQNPPIQGPRKQKSYTKTVSLDLQASEILPTKPNFDQKITVYSKETQHNYANVPETTQKQNATINKPSVSSMDEDVEFASNEMVLANLNPNPNSKSEVEIKGTSVTLKSETNTELYVNNAMISRNTAQTSKEQYDNVSKPIFEDPESPIFETFKEFSEQLALMNTKTSSTSNRLDGYESESESESGSENEAIPPRGQVQNIKAKPRLIKKPPRKSTKLRRKMSQSLTDLTSRNPSHGPESGVRNKDRPTSFMHDESLYDVPKSLPVYENIRTGSNTEPSNQNSNQAVDKKNESKQIGVTTKSVIKQSADLKDTKQYKMEAIKMNNPPDLIKQTNVGQKSLLSVQPDLTGTVSANENAASSKKTMETTQKPMTSQRRQEIRRSASDDIIYEDEQKKLREDLRRLTELQDELVETNDSIKRMWRTIQEDMLSMINQQVDSKTKRTTLPKAMTPNFGKKRKCVIM